MRIATYNVWNSSDDWTQRLEAISEEIAALDTDVVALQEAPIWADETSPFTDFLGERTGHTYILHLPYPDDPADERPEGLAFLSNLHVHTCEMNWSGEADVANNWAARIVVEWQGAFVGVTNVHLDYREVSGREQHIVRTVRDLIDRSPCEYEVLCGDFNGDDDSLVARYLTGCASIDGHQTSWDDAALTWHTSRSELAPITMDFIENPRWKAQPTGETPARFDRIYVRGSSKQPRVVGVGLFGKFPSNRYGLVPSDHYGVFVDLVPG